MLYLGSQLFEIARKLPNELLCDPHAAEHSEELPELLHLIGSLQNVELVYVGLSKAPRYGQGRDLTTGHMVAQIVVEDVQGLVNDAPFFDLG